MGWAPRGRSIDHYADDHCVSNSGCVRDCGEECTARWDPNWEAWSDEEWDALIHGLTKGIDDPHHDKRRVLSEYLHCNNAFIEEHGVDRTEVDVGSMAKLTKSCISHLDAEMRLMIGDYMDCHIMCELSPRGTSEMYDCAGFCSDHCRIMAIPRDVEECMELCELWVGCLADDAQYEYDPLKRQVYAVRKPVEVHECKEIRAGKMIEGDSDCWAPEIRWKKLGTRERKEVKDDMCNNSKSVRQRRLKLILGKKTGRTDFDRFDLSKTALGARDDESNYYGGDKLTSRHGLDDEL